MLLTEFWLIPYRLVWHVAESNSKMRFILIFNFLTCHLQEKKTISNL